MATLMQRRWQAQAMVTLLLAVGFAYQVSWMAAVAALYGGLVALINGLLFAWRITQARQKVAQSAQEDALMLLLSLFERLIWVVASLGFGLGVLGLLPEGVVVAFIAAQLVLLTVRTN